MAGFQHEIVTNQFALGRTRQYECCHYATIGRTRTHEMELGLT
jgi:hypothetical protein